MTPPTEPEGWVTQALLDDLANIIGEGRDRGASSNAIAAIAINRMIEAAPPAPVEPMPNRDQLGEMVRVAWVKWAKTQPDPKPSWLVPYAELSEPDKEADRQIGEAIWRAASRPVEPMRKALERTCEAIERALCEADFHPADIYDFNMALQDGRAALSTLPVAGGGEVAGLIEEAKAFPHKRMRGAVGMALAMDEALTLITRLVDALEGRL